MLRCYHPFELTAQTQFGEAMFEDVACMIYDLLDARRLYHTYIKNLKLQSVPYYGSASLEKVTGMGPFLVFTSVRAISCTM